MTFLISKIYGKLMMSIEWIFQFGSTRAGLETVDTSQRVVGAASVAIKWEGQTIAVKPSTTCFHEKALCCQDRLGGQKSGTG